MGLTQHELARGIYVPYQGVNVLVNPLRGLTPNTALRLSKHLHIAGFLDESAVTVGPLPYPTS